LNELFHATELRRDFHNLGIEEHVATDPFHSKRVEGQPRALRESCGNELQVGAKLLFVLPVLSVLLGVLTVVADLETLPLAIHFREEYEGFAARLVL
jgi:hypothetical protein